MTRLDKIEILIRDYLEKAKLMQIATVSKGKPWVASVWYVHDDTLNLYFISRKTRRHSLELKADPNVAGAITTPHVIGSGEKARGLQFEGTAEECAGRGMETARELYMKKYAGAEDISLEELRDPSFIAAFYVVHPSVFVLFDEVNFPKEPRQELRVGRNG